MRNQHKIYWFIINLFRCMNQTTLDMRRIAISIDQTDLETKRKIESVGNERKFWVEREMWTERGEGGDWEEVEKVIAFNYSAILIDSILFSAMNLPFRFMDSANMYRTIRLMKTSFGVSLYCFFLCLLCITSKWINCGKVFVDKRFRIWMIKVWLRTLLSLFSSGIRWILVHCDAIQRKSIYHQVIWDWSSVASITETTMRNHYADGS